MLCINPVKHPSKLYVHSVDAFRYHVSCRFFLVLTALILTLLGTGYPLSFVLNLIFTFFGPLKGHVHHSINSKCNPRYMRRYNIVPLILLILSIINFALAAPILIPEGRKVSVDVAHVPKDVMTVLEKRGNLLDKLEKLLEDLDKWGEDPESSTESGGSADSLAQHSSTTGSVTSSEADLDIDSIPSTPSPPESVSDESIPSLESVSDPDREEMVVGHDAPPPSSDSDRWSTISNVPSAESLFENLRTGTDKLKDKVKTERRITGTSRGAA